MCRAAAIALATAVSSTAALPAASSAAGVPTGQALVILSRDKTARSAPSLSARRLMTVAFRRPLSHVPTVLPVLGRAKTRSGSAWVRIRLPGRPDSSTGWITTDGTVPSWTGWRLSVSLRARVLTVYFRGRVSRRFRAVVGKPSTPTPTGQFFIEEGLSLAANASGAPFALATSARSNVLHQFDGGPGQIAIHGMGNLPGALGTASSHGCIRLDASDITWLVRRIGAGVPLSIHP
jgi:lipoprotein-anchoring transpeptidase ErfK/SrfK